VLGAGLVCGIGWKKEGFGGLNACFVCIFGQALKGQKEEVYPTGPVSEEDEWKVLALRTTLSCIQ
jgi:hypothetical protein